MNKRFNVLDSFRGLFAFVVAIFHYKAAGPISQLALFQQGDYFVDFFFVLSGFIIYHNYTHLTAGNQQLRFMKNRFFRIYPLHIVMLLVFLVMETLKYGLYEKGLFKSPVFVKNNLSTFFVNVFFGQSFSMTSAGWNYPSWSISAEMVTYLIFCFSIVYINRLTLSKRIISFLAIVLTALSIIYSINGNVDIKLINNFSMVRCMYGFFAGCITYEVYKLIVSEQRQQKTVITALEVVTLLTSLLLTSYLPEQLSFLLPISYAISVLVFSLEGGTLSQWLNNKLLNKVGNLSYSIYMTHAAIAIVFEIVLGVLKVKSPIFLSVALVAYVATIFLVSTITHQYVEVRLRKLMHKQSTPKFIDDTSNPNHISVGV